MIHVYVSRSHTTFKVSSEYPHPSFVSIFTNQDKRLLRKLKRDLKRTGAKRRRQFLKRALHETPEEAPYAEFDFGDTSTEGLNGMDKDSTRRRNPDSLAEDDHSP